MFAAPETYDGLYTAASDVYSWGQLAGYLLRGRGYEDEPLTTGGLTSRQFEALFECSIDPIPGNRPTAQDISFLFNPEHVVPGIETRTWAELMDGVADPSDRIFSKPGFAHRWIRQVRATRDPQKLRAATLRLDAKVALPEFRKLDGTTYRSGRLELKRELGYSVDIEHQSNKGFSVNSDVPRGIDYAWQQRIAFGYIPKDVENLPNEQAARILRAISRNVRLANELRQELLNELRFVSAERAQDLMAALAPDQKVPFKDAARSKHLIAVSDHGQLIYPAFQFEHGADGLAAVMMIQESFADEDNDWAVVSWWNSPHLLLDGSTPLQALDENPQMLVEKLPSEHRPQI